MCTEIGIRLSNFRSMVKIGAPALRLVKFDFPSGLAVFVERIAVCNSEDESIYR